MESQALHPGKSSTSRRLLVVAVLLATLDGLSLLARRTGLISWDLQPVVQGIAQPIQIDTNLPARLTDAPPPTGLMPQLRPTNAMGSGDILPVMPRAKPIVDMASRKPAKSRDLLNDIKSSARPVDPCVTEAACGIAEPTDVIPEDVSDHRERTGPVDEDVHDRHGADDLADSSHGKDVEDDHRDRGDDDHHGGGDSHSDGGHDRGDDDHHGGCRGRRG